MKLPNYSLEREVTKNGFKAVAGVDEVGRGGLAGPVVSAAVVIPEACIEELLEIKVNDSKKLSAKKREELYGIITKNCNYGVGVINNDIIDEINILESTKLSMAAAVNSLEHCDYVFIDGNTPLKIHHAQTNVIKGDSISLSIAAASIVAKVTRDRLVLEIHKKFPIYEFDRNKTYGTKRHKELILLYGPSIYHRKSFRGVKEHVWVAEA